jgi:26S proteasome regulatory subunit N9
MTNTTNYCLFFYSLKLIRGTLDQVAEKASITWVQPRVLSREQIGGLAQRLDAWTRKLGGVEDRVGSGMAGVAA